MREIPPVAAPRVILRQRGESASEGVLSKPGAPRKVGRAAGGNERSLSLFIAMRHEITIGR